MNKYSYKDLIIELTDEPTYKLGSIDNDFNYSNFYLSEKSEFIPTTKHGIKIYQQNQLVDNCIVIGFGGATGIFQNSSVIDNDMLVICCSDTVFGFALANLELKWKTQADQFTCFQIFKLQNDFIIHGESQITRLDRQGNKKWEFSGEDIFVSKENQEAFKIESDGILLTDFSNTKYKIDFNGKLH
jgi:hypothetical protein